MNNYISFFTEDIVYNLRNRIKLRQWLSQVLLLEDKKLQNLNYIFCSDSCLLQLNIDYLKHNTLTDVITFDQSDIIGLISGDIFISIERVRENAGMYKQNVSDELHRVMIHGLLHLCGYKDKSPKEKNLMTAKENFYLEMYKSM